MIATSIRLDTGAAVRLAQRCGMTDWPVAMAVYPSADRIDEATAAAAHADRILESSGLLDAGRPAAWVSDAVEVLADPERELEIRTVATDTVQRACLVRRGTLHTLVIDDGTHMVLRLVEAADTARLGELVSREVIPALHGVCPPLRIGDISAPADELAQVLGHAGDRAALSSALAGIGADSTDTAQLCAALVSCRRRTEIVAVGRVEGRAVQCRGTVGIADTECGRILFSPNESPDGIVWTTLTSGIDSRIGRAIAGLLETIPGGGWFP
ncbi:ESX secretion-associated protein EspG [Gordonia sp. VNQ95]|uniref:ESX secretion-associated protein EspG n=1 Tax=Gordonia sp. VNQ95 TaxID=3156619 RepID=UPI0032B39E83